MFRVRAFVALFCAFVCSCVNRFVCCIQFLYFVVGFGERVVVIFLFVFGLRVACFCCFVGVRLCFVSPVAFRVFADVPLRQLRPERNCEENVSTKGITQTQHYIWT